MVKETSDKIDVFGEGKESYLIPLSEIQTTEINVLIGLKITEMREKYSKSLVGKGIIVQNVYKIGCIVTET